MIGTVATVTANVRAADVPPASDTPRLVVAALLGIAVVVVLITWAKVHPFVSLILGGWVLGVAAGLPLDKTIASFSAGVGSTVGSVGLLIALGAMIGGLLTWSGGADRVVETVVGRVAVTALPWAMAGVAALIGIPLFFEVGVVLLVPIVILVHRRTGVPLLLIGIPALAGLSVLHGLVPPHPGPLIAIAAVGADIGTTLLFGLIIAIPTVIIAGPVFARFISRYVTTEAPADLVIEREVVAAGVGVEGDSRTVRSTVDTASRHAVPARGRPRGTAVTSAGGVADAAASDLPRTPADDVPARTSGQPVQGRTVDLTDAATRGRASTPPDDLHRGRAARVPGFWATVLTVLLPVILMLARAVGELTLPEDSNVRKALDIAGTPVIALMAGLVLAMFTMGFAVGHGRQQVSGAAARALPPIAGIILIVAAGGGFKQVLIDAGVGTMVADAARNVNLSPLLLGWLVAVGIRVATGSATVATITAAGIVTPLAAGLDSPTLALLVLAVGCGSLFFSHVNDAGFWMVKEYFGMTVGQTIKTWSVMETIISVVGLIGVLLLSLVV